ncbi:S41 family peptidase [Alkalimarinus coralli]|uniref:S41 family peptidase n=1 Tax=Alkalimarinus coralli TaxID=2935863 RepID=UPI0023DF36DA|nr:S41 family peptidase [Alkalimarinus coralli]
MTDIQKHLRQLKSTSAALISLPLLCLLALQPSLALSEEATSNTLSSEQHSANDVPLQTDKAEENPQRTVITLPDPAKQLPLDDLRKFTEVFDRIKKTYVEEVDDTTLLNNAIKGMLSGLDPHSAYLEPSAFEDLQESTSGQFGGLGIEVGQENGFVKVIAPIDDTPAQKAGVEAGDLIIKLDDTPVKGMSLDEAVKLMRGEPGSPIVLTIARESESGPIEITIIRDVIKVTSVKTRLLEPGYGYLRITQFQAQTGEDFSKGLEKLKAENKGELNGLILDLRNNPGGVLQAAVAVSDSLLEEGLIVYTEGRIKSSQLRFSATPGDELNGKPVIVLINGGSASASEIVSGALQDQGRAIIMGTESFGKGSVQTVMQLNEENGLKLTTARYYTPNGRSIQALGIVPDIEVKRAKLTELQSQEFFKEADLAGHLSNGKTEKSDSDKAVEGGESSDGDDSSSNDPSTILERDFQLREAINLLKGLTILSKRADEN